MKQEDASIARGTAAALTRNRLIDPAHRLDMGASPLWAAFATIGGAVFISDGSGEFVDFNDAFATFHRFKSREECSTRFADYAVLFELHTLDGVLVPVDQWPLSRAIRGESATDVEVSIRRTDTGETWIGSYNFAPIHDADGRIIGTVTTARDVTRRRRAEAAEREALRQLEAANRLLAMGEELAHAGIWHYDAIRQKLDWTDGMYRIIGFPKEEGRPNLQEGIRIWHPEDRPGHRACIETALATGTGFLFHGRMLRTDGSIGDVSEIGRCEFGPDGKVIGIFGVIQDTTEVMEAKRNLAAANTRLQLATQSGKVAIWEVYYPEMRLVADETMREITGIEKPLDEITQEEWWGAVHPDDATAARRLFERSFQTGEPFDAAYRIVLPNGDVRHHRGRGSLVRDAAGKPQKIIGTLWDVTEIQMLNERLTAEKQRAEDANLAKSNFLAMMSHEIRTPMNGIMGMNELLLGTGLDPKQKLYAETIRDSSVALLKIIDGILDLSKLEAGKVQLEAAEFDLHELVEQSITVFSPAVEGKGLQLAAMIDLPRPATYLGDGTVIRQVLLNLVGNAVKFTERGAVTIAVAQIAMAEDRPRLRIEVRDTGIGIAPETKEKLFKPFEQADSTITRRFGGTGLGLSISKRLVELMGGRIGVDDNPGGGCIFWFELALQQVAAPAPGVDPDGDLAAPPDAAPAARRILVVEDNRINALVLSAFLEAGGYGYDIAADGLDAIAAVRARPYDLILMDVQMPRLDGLSATREIRRLESGGRRVPIIAMTANAMKEDERRCLEAGMDDYLAKPLGTKSVYDMLARWIVPAGTAPAREH